MADEDDSLDAGLEALRRRGGNGVMKPPGRIRPASGKNGAGLRKSASVSALPPVPVNVPPEVLRELATDNVQTQLIASLDKDCTAYLKKIEKLEKQLLARNVNISTSSSREAARVAALQHSLDQLQAELDATMRERDALTATVARLSRDKGGPAEALALANEQLGMARAEIATLQLQLAQGAEQLKMEQQAARAADARHDAAAAKAADQIAKLEKQLAEAQQRVQQQDEAVAALSKELEAAHAATAAARAHGAGMEDDLSRAKREADAANLEAVEAKGESSILARRLAGMVERRDDREKKAGKEAADDKDRRKAADAVAAKAASEASSLRGELGGVKGELTREREVVKALMTKLAEASSTNDSAAKAAERAAKTKKAAEKLDKRAAALEAANVELQESNVNLREQLTRAQGMAEKAEADAAARAAGAAEAQARLEARAESLAATAASGDKSSSFGKYQAKVRNLEAEIAQLKSQLSGAGPGTVSKVHLGV